MKCPNCDNTVERDWTHCVKCGANLTLRKFSSDDDPVKRVAAVETKVDKIAKYLEDKDAEENDEPKPLKGGKKDVKRKSIFD